MGDNDIRVDNMVEGYPSVDLEGYFRTLWKSKLGQKLIDKEFSFKSTAGNVYDEKSVKEIKHIISNFPGDHVSFSSSVGKHYICRDESIIEFDLKFRNSFTTLSVTCISSKQTILDSIILEVENRLPEGISARVVDFEWYFPTGNGPKSVNFKDVIYEDFLDESYPSFEEGIETWAENYLKSSSPITMLFGPSGTGKTKLIRYITRKAAKMDSYKDIPRVMYISGQDTVSIEELFVLFLDQDYDFLILEDLDDKLKPRTEGNSDMSTLLTASDGVVSSMNKKIMITSNIPSISKSDIDGALLRPGRCFDVRKLDHLSSKQAKVVLNKISKNGRNLSNRLENNKEYPLSDLYFLEEHNRFPNKDKELKKAEAGF